MNWEAVTAVAEWSGVILIVVSLVYVAMQIKQNTQMIKASTELETAREWTAFHARTAHSPDMVDIWDKALTDPTQLTPTEKRRFIWFISEYCSLVESVFRQRRMGYISREWWLQHERSVTGLLAHPLVHRWWESGVTPYSESFKNAIDKAKADRGHIAWKYTPLSDL